METLVSSESVFMHFETIDETHCVLDKPSEKWVIRWDPAIESCLTCRFQSPEHVLD